MNIGISLWNIQNPVGYDAAADALFARMSTPPTDARKTQINTAIVALKGAGVWNKLDALWVMAAADSQAANLNWINSSYTLSPVNSPTFTADRGYVTDGATQYVDTNWLTSNGPNWAQNSCNIFMHSRKTGNTSNGNFGWFDGTVGAEMNPHATLNRWFARMQSFTSSSTNNQTTSPGFYAVSRNSGASFTFLKNGTNIASVSVASVASASGGSFKLGSTASAVFQATDAAALGVGGYLTDSENAALYSAINTYLTSVGAA